MTLKVIDNIGINPVLETKKHDTRASDVAVRSLAGSQNASRPLIDLEKRLQTDLPVHRGLIKKAFPTLMTENTCLQKPYEEILSNAWMNKKVKSLQEHRSSHLEAAVLKHYGYKTPTEESENQLRLKLQTLLCSYDAASLTFEELQAKFEQEAQETRLMSLGVQPQNLALIKELVNAMGQAEEYLIMQAEQMVDAKQLDLKLPLAIIKLKRKMFKSIKSDIKVIFEVILATAGKGRRLALNICRDKNTLRNALQKTFEASEAMIEKRYAWLKAHEDEFIIEFAQGAGGPNDILGFGVCLAMAYEMAEGALNSPATEPENISIGARTRNLQAFHHLKVSQKATAPQQRLPSEVLAEKGIKEINMLETEGDLEVQAQLESTLLDPALEKSNGGLMLAWGRHATFMRFDPKQNRFYFFEPNMGLLRFTPKAGESLKALASRMTETYLSLARCAYHKRKLFRANQFIKI